MRNQYFILRHGENVWQVEKKGFVYPWGICRQIKLTEKGKVCVKESSAKLKKEKIDLIFSSDFQRTRETAKIAAKELGIKKINFDKRLRDIDLGIYNGRPRKDFLEFCHYKERKFSTKPPKGESWNDVRERIKNFIQEIDKNYKGKNILIIGHGDPLCLLEGVIKRKTDKQLLKEIHCGNYIKVAELRKID
ncbi:MAG: histidine phosphatase family protein [Candidatus Pacebacteria bacterium]|nr:histidine phosphatase family protein [Candidatus Paceibacterota bacterium]